MNISYGFQNIKVVCQQPSVQWFVTLTLEYTARADTKNLVQARVHVDDTHYVMIIISTNSKLVKICIWQRAGGSPTRQIKLPAKYPGNYTPVNYLRGRILTGMANLTSCHQTPLYYFLNSVLMRKGLEISR